MIIRVGKKYRYKGLYCLCSGKMQEHVTVLATTHWASRGFGAEVQFTDGCVRTVALEALSPLHRRKGK